MSEITCLCHGIISILNRGLMRYSTDAKRVRATLMSHSPVGFIWRFISITPPLVFGAGMQVLSRRTEDYNRFTENSLFRSLFSETGDRISPPSYSPSSNRSDRLPAKSVSLSSIDLNFHRPTLPRILNKGDRLGRSVVCRDHSRVCRRAIVIGYVIVYPQPTPPSC